MKEKMNDLPVKERLLIAATKLFAEKGFEGTTTRAIATEANANLSAIPFYFDTKEKLYFAALERVVDIFDEIHRPLFNEIDLSENEGILSHEAAWNYIVELISGQIEWCTNRTHLNEIMLINQELLHPHAAVFSFQAVLPAYRYMEKLLLQYAQSNDILWARNYSFLTITALYAYNNYPVFVKAFFEREIFDDKTGFGKTKADLKRDALCGIKAVLESRRVIEEKMK